MKMPIYKSVIKYIETILENRINNYHNLFYFAPIIFASSVSLYFKIPYQLNNNLYYIFGIVFLFSLYFFLKAKTYFYGAFIWALTGFYNIFFIAFLLVSYEAYKAPVFPALPSESLWIEGDVIDQRFLPEMKENGQRAEEIILKNIHFLSVWDERKTPSLRYASIRLKKRFSKKNKYKMPDKEHYFLGAHIRVRVLFHHIAPSSWVYGRDLQRDAYFSNMMGSAVALSSVKILKNDESLWSFLEQWRLLRLFCAREIMTIVPGQEGAVIATLLFGDRENISAQTRKDFSVSGLSHLLAVAGLHLTIVMGVVFTVLHFVILRFESLILRTFPRFLALLGALCFGGVYIALTGFHIPALRAFGGAFFFLLGIGLKREPIALRLLAVIAFILEIFDPSIILDISFQMSFAAVMCILSSLARRREFLKKKEQEVGMISQEGSSFKQHVLEYFTTMTRLSCLAALPTIPLAMAYFGAFQPLFLIANSIAIPIMSFLVMPLLLLGLVFWAFPFKSIFFILAGKAIGVILWFAHQVTYLPFATYKVPSFPSWAILVYFIGLSCFCFLSGKERFIGVMGIVIACISPWMIDRPVIFIAADGDAIGIREKGKIFVAPRSQLFIEHQWSKDMALPLAPLSEKCPSKDKFCRLNIFGKNILLYLGTNLPEKEVMQRLNWHQLCDHVGLYISLAHSRPLCGAIPTLERGDMLGKGAWNIYESRERGFRLLSVSTTQGVHPWTSKKRAEERFGLPFAQEE